MARPALTQQHIITLLKEHHVLSAMQILHMLEKEDQGVNKTTVYRALDKMLADGLVCRQVFESDELMYELRTDHHHDHLVCEDCGNVEITSCQTGSPRAIAGFLVGHHHTTFFGTCKNCTAK